MITRYLKEKNDPREELASLKAELRRAWLLEVKPYFEAEMDFLREHGPEEGFAEEAIHRIKAFHSRMEDLVFSEDENSLREFVVTLGLYLQFKGSCMNPNGKAAGEVRWIPATSEGQ